MGPWRHSKMFPWSFWGASLKGVRPQSSEFCRECHHPSPSQDPPSFSEPSSENSGCPRSSRPFPCWLWVGSQHWLVWGQGVLGPSFNPTTILLKDLRKPAHLSGPEFLHQWTLRVGLKLNVHLSFLPALTFWPSATSAHTTFFMRATPPQGAFPSPLHGSHPRWGS